MTEDPKSRWKVRYSYLPEQFADPAEILEELRRFIPSGDFTLGKPVVEFERRFADLLGARHAVGVGSGTDAIKLALKAVRVGPGDEVVTAANTFIATVGAIAELGAKPILVDCDDTFCMDVGQAERAVTARTKAILPVQLTGCMVDMPRLLAMANSRGIPVIEDACQAILANIDGRSAGTWGRAGAFSLHPLKNLNVWGDAGVIVTNDDGIAESLRLLRNHGLQNRDEIAMFGFNSRLDSVQAIVGNWLMQRLHAITEKRIANAAYYDRGLAGVRQIRIPPRPKGYRLVYHLYMVFAEDRDALHRHCLERGVETKVHYPVPLYRQQGLQPLGYKVGDFPVSDRHAAEIITLPADQHLSQKQLDYVVETVADFYTGR